MSKNNLAISSPAVCLLFLLPTNPKFLSSPSGLYFKYVHSSQPLKWPSIIFKSLPGLLYLFQQISFNIQLSSFSLSHSVSQFLNPEFPLFRVLISTSTSFIPSQTLPGLIDTRRSRPVSQSPLFSSFTAYYLLLTWSCLLPLALLNYEIQQSVFNRAATATESPILNIHYSIINIPPAPCAPYSSRHAPSALFFTFIFLLLSFVLSRVFRKEPGIIT